MYITFQMIFLFKKYIVDHEVRNITCNYVCTLSVPIYKNLSQTS